MKTTPRYPRNFGDNCTHKAWSLSKLWLQSSACKVDSWVENLVFFRVQSLVSPLGAIHVIRSPISRNMFPIASEASEPVTCPVVFISSISVGNNPPILDITNGTFWSGWIFSPCNVVFAQCHKPNGACFIHQFTIKKPSLTSLTIINQPLTRINHH